MTYNVYLSSTLMDLKDEREAVRQALSDECVVKHSYIASENAVVDSCLQDVADCDVYMLILGMRYGYVPQRGLDNPDNLSITELEYKQASNKPRLVFIKETRTIPFSLTDAATKDHPLERIEGFRKRAAEDQRAIPFETADDLKLAVVKAFNGWTRELRRKDLDDSFVRRISSQQTSTVHRGIEDAIRVYLQELENEVSDYFLQTAALPNLQQSMMPVTGSMRFQTPPPVVSALPTSFLAPSMRERRVPRRFASLASALRFYHRLMLLGPAGSGKTTSLLRLAHEAAQRRLENPAASVPLTARLSTWDGSTHRSFSDYLASEIPLLRPPIIKQLLENGRALLLLDGLDEVRWRRAEPPKALGPDPRHTLLELIPTSLPLIITCRQSEAEELANEALTLPVSGALVLNELSNDVRSTTLSHHKQLAALAESDPGIKRLTRNPLMLSLLLSAYDRASHELQRASELGEPALRELIVGVFIEERWRHERDKYGSGLSFELEDLYNFWGPIAMRDAGGGGNVNDFSLQDLPSTLDPAPHRKLLFLRLSHTLGLIYSRIPGRISFTHLLFRDHFAFRHAKTALFDQDPGTRDSAAWALWQIPDSGAVPLLIQALRDPYEYARGSAAGALGMIKDPRAVDELAKLLNDRTWVVSIYGHSIAEVAAWALRQIGTPAALAFVQNWNQGS